jgi:hypothetical protein
MWILVLEACGALLALVLIVWWTMFHGRGPERHGRGAPGARKEDDTPRR